MTRRRPIAAASLVAVAAAAALYAVAIEPRWVAVTRHELGARVPGARAVRVAQVSDLHMHAVGPRERRVIEVLRAERPDVVVFTGDFVDSAGRVAAVSEFLAALDLPAPKYAVPGNWDHDHPLKALARAFAAHGGALLVNASATLPDGEVVVGIDDSTGGRPDPAKACAGAAGAREVLVITHSPKERDASSACAGAVAMLAGHTHGGQVTLLGWAPVRPPGSGRYTSGWYRGAPIDLYVSRGIGTTLLPVRFGARPEVAVFDWWIAPGPPEGRRIPDAARPRWTAGGER